MKKKFVKILFHVKDAVFLCYILLMKPATAFAILDEKRALLGSFCQIAV